VTVVLAGRIAMSAYKLITDQEIAAYLAAIERNGWRKEDFDLQEDAYDQPTAEVEAAFGEVGVHCLVTEAVQLYRLGPGFEWAKDFDDDLRHGKFGRRTQAR
jgi:hypothetical protein